MAGINSYKDLIVWQRSIELVKEVYQLTKDFPKEEVFGLVSQIRRAVVSIASNIAEGSSRRYPNEWRQFHSFALGSAFELETQLIISKELSLVSEDQFKRSFELLEEVSKMLNTISHNLKNNYLASNELKSNI